MDFVVPVEHRVKIKERPDLVLINKKNLSFSGFCRSVEYRVKIKERPDLVWINKKNLSFSGFCRSSGA